MPRSRVLSFILGQRNSIAEPESKPAKVTKQLPQPQPPTAGSRPPTTEPLAQPKPPSAQKPSPAPPLRSGTPSYFGDDAFVNDPQTRKRSSSRPQSILQAYQAPVMDIGRDTIPELQPIFSFLNHHGNKLYQEGYFLKLDDQNTQGRPNPDRTWTECFAQLVGTVLSLWDAAELDAAGQNGEVLPKFINLTDASIKMINSLPTRSVDEQPLQNILSLSTAGRNRYLLHFNSHDALTQWTAAIRLAMYEHTTLQEAYTGSLIAAKGKTLNNINVIMERMRVKSEAWVRVRFGAGVPWRRCWCVISPPDEKEYQKLQKELKKRSPYDRSHIPVLKGDIKFYDNKKESTKKKKAKPIATIADAQAAYAIYPQAKALIDASTLLKIEGTITIHSDPPSTTEGFVFIMPETNPAVSGFEMLLRYLFPTWDTFGLYGRPGRLVASTLDARSLMFAMPKGRRYGYMDVTDVAGLISSEGSDGWSEREWRKRMKELTGQRMNEQDESGHSRSDSDRSNHLSYGTGPNGGMAPQSRVGFANNGAFTPLDMSYNQDQPPLRNGGPPPSGPGMPGQAHFSPNPQDAYDYPNGMSMPSVTGHVLQSESMGGAQYRMGGGHDTPMIDDRDLDGMRQMQTPEPVSQPPAFNHGGQHDPNGRAYHSAEMRRATVRLSETTLSHIAKGGGVPVPADGPLPGGFGGNGPPNGQYSQPVPVDPSTHPVGASANDNGSRKVLNPPGPLPSESAAPIRSHSPANRSLPRTARDGPISGDLSRSSTESRSTISESRLARTGPNPPVAIPSPHAGRYSPRTPSGRSASPSSLSQQSSSRREPRQGRSGLQNEVLPSLDTSPPRKPIPSQGPPGEKHGNVSPQTASSVDSFSDHMIDRAILERIRANETDDIAFPDFHREDSMSSTSSGHYTHTRQYISDSAPPARRVSRAPSYRGVEHGPPQLKGRGSVYRQGSVRSSHHSLTNSTSTPDYASTHKSTDTAASGERPRVGVLRTVGGAESPARSLTSDFSIPDVNFGPTIDYSKQPKAKVASPPPMQATRKPPANDQGHSRQDSSDTVTPRRRSIMWQPAGGASSGSAGAQGVSVEEYVQQRAAAASTPVVSHSRGSSTALVGNSRSTTPTPSMGHARSPSGNTLGPGRSTTPTPTMARTISDDLLNKRRSRSSSTDLLQRPSSRGANSILDAANAQRASSQLSARELEQVARMTGSPLISMAGNGPPAQNPGLVGAIQAREKEKQQVKAGYSSQTMQNAINQRERQMHQRQMQQQQAYHQQRQQQQGIHHPNMSQGQMRYPPQQQQGPWQGQPQQQQRGYGYGQMGGGYRQPPMGAGYRPGPTGLGHPQQGQPRSAAVRSPPLRGPAPGVPHAVPAQGQYRYPQGGQGPMYQGNAFL